MTNQERAERAQEALDSIGGLYDDTDTVLADLLADLMHLSGRESVAEAVRMAEVHYECECDEEEDPDAD